MERWGKFYDENNQLTHYCESPYTKEGPGKYNVFKGYNNVFDFIQRRKAECRFIICQSAERVSEGFREQIQRSKIPLEKINKILNVINNAIAEIAHTLFKEIDAADKSNDIFKSNFNKDQFRYKIKELMGDEAQKAGDQEVKNLGLYFRKKSPYK